MNALLELQHVSIGFDPGKPLLKDLNITVSSGEQIAMLGENGQGKTTLLKTIAGILSPMSGTLMWSGKPFGEMRMKKWAENVSIVLTEKPMIGNVVVKDLIGFGRYPYTNWLGMESEKDREYVELAIERCHLTDLRDAMFSELSDGEKQKVMIARSVAQHTNMILLDEPTAHLDLNNRLMIADLLADLSKNNGTTIIYSTHDVESVLKSGHRVWLLESGRLHDDSGEELVRNGSFEKAFSKRAMDHLGLKKTK